MSLKAFVLEGEVCFLLVLGLPCSLLVFLWLALPGHLKYFLSGRYNCFSYVLCLQMYPWVAALRKHLGETLVNGFLSYPSFTSDATIIAGISKVLCVLKYSSILHNRAVALKSLSPTHCTVDLAPVAKSTEGCRSWFSPPNFPRSLGMESRSSHPGQAFLTHVATAAAHSVFWCVCILERIRNGGSF